LLSHLGHLIDLNNFHSLLIDTLSAAAVECARGTIVVAMGELLSEDRRTAWTPLAQLKVRDKNLAAASPLDDVRIARAAAEIARL